MTGRALGRILADGVRGLGRARWQAAAAVGVLGLTFALPAATLVAADGLAAGVRAWGRPGLLRVYLEEGRTVAEAEAVAAELRPRLGSGRIDLLPPETLRARFAERFPEMADLPGLLPVEPFPPELEVDAADLTEADRAALVKVAEGLEGVAAVVTDALWSERLDGVATRLRRLGQGVASIMVLAAAAVVAGVIRLSLAARREEIDTMLVVGAPRLWLAGPFVVEGVLLATGGAALGLLGGWGGLRLVRRMVEVGALTGWPLPPPPVPTALALCAAAAVAGGAGAVLALSTTLVRGEGR